MNNIRFLLYSMLLMIYILSNFVGYDFLPFIIGVLALIVLTISFSRSSGLYKKSGVVFFLAGLLLFIYNGLSWQSIFLYFDSMLGVLSLFWILPFINSIIRIGRYDKSLSRFMQQGVTNLSTLYNRSFLASHFLGLFLNIATVPLLQNTLKSTMSNVNINTANKFYTQSLLRGYALCITWSPLEIMVIISLDLTGYSYFYLFPVTVPIVLIMIVSDWFLAKRKYRHTLLHIEDQVFQPLILVYKKIFQMMVMLLLLVVLATLLDYQLDKGFLFSMVLIIIPISMIWALFIKKLKRYLIFTIPQFKKRTIGLSNFFFMFLSAGFFVEMLSLSSFISLLEAIFSMVSDNLLLLYLLIGAYFLITSFIGFHPLVSITLLAEILMPIMPEISSISLTVVLVTSSLSTAMYGPYNLSVSLLSNQLNINPLKLSSWNLLFSIYYMVVSILLAYFLTFFL